MLARSNRLHREQDIRRVLRTGRVVKVNHLLLRYRRRASSAETRATFVVSTKVAKKATTRNRLKRVLRSLVADQLSRLPQGTDLLISVVRPVGANDRAVLASDLAQIFSRLPQKHPS